MPLITVISMTGIIKLMKTMEKLLARGMEIEWNRVCTKDNIQPKVTVVVILARPLLFRRLRKKLVRYSLAVNAVLRKVSEVNPMVKSKEGGNRMDKAIMAPIASRLTIIFIQLTLAEVFVGVSG